MDCYSILGVSPHATSDEIRQAYVDLALKWHPDRHVGESPEKIKEAEEIFKLINEAYYCLKEGENKYFREEQPAGSSSAGTSGSTYSSSGTASRSYGRETGSGGYHSSGNYRSGTYGSPYGSRYSYTYSSRGANERGKNRKDGKKRSNWKRRIWETFYYASMGAAFLLARYCLPFGDVVSFFSASEKYSPSTNSSSQYSKVNDYKYSFTPQGGSTQFHGKPPGGFPSSQYSKVYDYKNHFTPRGSAIQSLGKLSVPEVRLQDLDLSNLSEKEDIVPPDAPGGGTIDEE